MIWNNHLLFLHPQKTAGMSLTNVLLDTLAPPIFNSLPPGHWPEHPEGKPGVAYVYGLRHENQYQAKSILKQFNLSLDDFKVIMVVMRNPYDMEVSRYFHLRKPDAFETSSDRELALKSSFSEFVVNTQFRKSRPYHPDIERFQAIQSYYTTGDSIPPNLRIVHYEHLEEDINNVLGSLGYSPVKIPYVNISHERSSRDIMDFITSPEIEYSVYSRYAWIFNHNYYPRIAFKADK